MASAGGYVEGYENSWALVVGINAYRRTPLAYACNDANAVTKQLVERCNFPQSNVTVLLDQQATRQGIMSALLSLVGKTKENDRVLMFYAGHGCTQSGRRGEVGYLVPCDGDPDDLASLIRWDELTRNAELIPAKHMLFIMDACYGGLAVTRSLPPGSARFVGDMLSRYARQVLTAGKADEQVADSGGPRPGNSVFTGHLLEGLDGAAESADGVLSANTVMAYVYDRVAKDLNSRQTPHYGFLDGDGDFMFRIPAAQPVQDGKSHNVLLQIPADLQAPSATKPERALDEVKECLSDPKHRIRLEDLVTRQVRAGVERCSETEFPVHTASVTSQDVVERLNKYEAAVKSLLPTTALIARWADEQQVEALGRIVGSFAELDHRGSGNVLWSGLRSYPATLLMYVGGIGAIAGKNYRALTTVITTRVRDRDHDGATISAVVPTVNGILEVNRADGFKIIPGHERHHVPASEYLFQRVQPPVEDVLSLGSRYEECFDRFEVLRTLSFMDLTDRAWGPPGRFVWKYKRGDGRDPFSNLVAEAAREGERWPIIQHGLFGGSSQKFVEIAGMYKGRMDEIQWF